jgi:integrase/recombinase XerD
MAGPGTVEGDRMEYGISGFIDFLTHDRDRAPNTTHRYRELLIRFTAFAHASLGRDTISPADIDRRLVEMFVRHGGRQEESLAAASTRNVRLAALRGYFAYLISEGHVITNPTAGLRPAKVKSRSPGYVTEGEFLRLLAAVETATTEHYAARDIAVMTVLFHCGLRVSEALSLTLSQVNFESLCFHGVMRKGRIIEDVAMNQTTAEALRRWFVYRKTYRRAEETNALFLSDRSLPLSVRALERNFAGYVAASGFQNRHLSPHSLRHSCATAMVKHGVPLSTVSAVLAHQKIETTKIYVRLEGREKREAVALLDPKPSPPRRKFGASNPASEFNLTGIPDSAQLTSNLSRNGRSPQSITSRFP